MAYAYKINFKSGIQLTHSFSTAAEIGETYQLEVNGSKVRVKCIDPLTLIEISNIDKSDIATIAASLVILIGLIGGGIYSFQSQIGLSPNASVIAAANQAVTANNPNEKLTISNSESSVWGGCSKDDAQIYRVFGEDKKQKGIVCAGSTIVLPWVAQKAPTFRSEVK